MQPMPTPTSSTPSSGLSPTSASGAPTPTTTPSATSSWNPTQTTAVKVIEDYFATKERLLAYPSRYSKAEATAALEPLLGPDMLNGVITLFKGLKADGERYEGNARLAWIQASGVFGSGVGESVNVTVCRDPRGQALVDRAGKVIARVPASIREFEVRNGGSGFRVVGEKQGFGEPCP